jgi:hypothetical protein
LSVVELKTELKIITLISTRICCPSGNKIIIFSMAYESRELIQHTSIDLPGLYSGFYLNPVGEYDFYAIPHRSRQFHLLHMSFEVSESIRRDQSDRIRNSTTTAYSYLCCILYCSVHDHSCHKHNTNREATSKANFMLCNYFTLIVLTNDTVSTQIFVVVFTLPFYANVSSWVNLITCLQDESHVDVW